MTKLNVNGWDMFTPSIHDIHSRFGGFRSFPYTNWQAKNTTYIYTHMHTIRMPTHLALAVLRNPCTVRNSFRPARTRCSAAAFPSLAPCAPPSVKGFCFPPSTAQVLLSDSVWRLCVAPTTVFQVNLRRSRHQTIFQISCCCDSARGLGKQD